MHSEKGLAVEDTSRIDAAELELELDCTNALLIPLLGIALHGRLARARRHSSGTNSFTGQGSMLTNSLFFFLWLFLFVCVRQKDLAGRVNFGRDTCECRWQGWRQSQWVSPAQKFRLHYTGSTWAVSLASLHLAKFPWGSSNCTRQSDRTFWVRLLNEAPSPLGNPIWGGKYPF